MSSDGTHFAATTANRTSYGRTVGIAATAGDSATPVVQMIEVGIIPPSITGLAAGAVSWVRASSAGLLERVTPGAGDDIVGQAHADGSVQFLPGVFDSDNYAGGSSFTAGGDLTGTTSSQTVAKVNGTTITTAGGALAVGAVLRTTAAGTADWGTLDLADADARTGILPAANQAAQTLTGDASGTTAAVVVDIARGLKSATTTVSISAATAPTVGQVLTAVNGTTATWQAGGGGASSTGSAGALNVSDGAGDFQAANGTLTAAAGDYISFGANVASAGYLRCDVPVSDAQFVTYRRSGSTYDALKMQSAVVYLGNTTFGTRIDGAGITLFSVADTTIWGTSTLVATASSTALSMAKPIIGDSASSSPYGLNGVGTQAMADANQTPAASVYRYNTIKTTGAITANRDLTLPGATDAAAYTKMINNTCTGGGFGLVIKASSGLGDTVGIANLMSAMVLIDSRGVTRLTDDA
jgi:hypothetical protein